MLGKTFELHELHSAVLEKELTRKVVSTTLAHRPYHQQLQLVAMVLTPSFVRHLEQTAGYAAYFTQLVLQWRRQRAELTP